MDEEGLAIEQRSDELVIEKTSLARVIGYACNRSWAYLTFFSPALYIGSISSSSVVLDDSYFYSIIFLFSTLVICVVAHKKVERLLSNDRGAMVGPITIALGTLILPFLRGDGSHLINPLFWFSVLATGIGSALLLLAWGRAFSRLPLRQLVIEAASGYSLAAILYPLLLMLPDYMVVVLAVILPVISGILPQV